MMRLTIRHAVPEDEPSVVELWRACDLVASYNVASTPHSRGTGIGRQMVQAAEEWLRQRGVVKAQLLVREPNTRVVSFYEHLGYEVAPRVVMGKWLGPPG